MPNTIEEILDANNNLLNISYDGVFMECTNLKEIVWSSKLWKIGTAAFANCSSLETITIPESVTSMGSYVFNGCTSLKTIYVPFTEGNEPPGWDINWKEGCNAEVIYKTETE